ncbi:metal-sensitive transcriptional regulator [Corynebacterium senegalense]|uniref:metal-sensitive transcriptional regulator n=1 Tax=Corynebacterium senegalense TaxID=2080750 RepID=UPI000E2026C0|nr:metal-sensitive transcriptional regulator [Corynebacterium senegalense]
MQLTEAEMKPSISRLKRARGQLDAVIRMMEEGQDCTDVVTQLSAANKAVSRASFQVLSTIMKRSYGDDAAGMDPADEEKMFLSFA